MGLFNHFNWKSRSQIGRKLGFAATKSMSTSRCFRSVSDDKLKKLKEEAITYRTLAKVRWAVKAYSDWRKNILSSTDTFDSRIYDLDLSRVDILEKDSFEFSMCKFIAEVKKVNGDEYPGKTLYHIVVSIQKHLLRAGKKWKLVESVDFARLCNVLDNLMKERAKDNIGLTKRQAGLINENIENRLWNDGILGEENPDQLQSTVLFLLGLNLGLRAGDEHYALRRDSPTKASQLSFKRNDKGVRCLVYTEDSVTKTNQGGLKHMRKDRKIVWVYPSENATRCPVRIVDKYICLLPPVKPTSKKCNFYLRSLDKKTPAQWYGEQVVGLNFIRKVMKELLAGTEIEGFFSNHSLRRTGTTRLFRSGVDRKLVKEYSGHTSDAVDAYQITSDEQREHMSKVINATVTNDYQNESEKVSEVEIKVSDVCDKVPMTCSCNKQNVKLNEVDRLGEMITQVIEKRKGLKTKIKLEIEFCE